MLTTSAHPTTVPPPAYHGGELCPPADHRSPATLVLRQRCADDAEDLYALLSQPDFQRHGWTLDPFSSIDDIEGFVLGTGPRNIEIVGSIHDTIVGFAGLYILPGRQAHVGSFMLTVHQDFQRIGIGTALMTAISCIGFQMMGLQRLQATVFVDNTRALSLYRRFGFTIEGRLNRFALRDDGFVDAHLISLLR